MSPALFLFLALSPLIVRSYNVDTKHYIVHEDPDPEPGRQSYFGYSVSLSAGRSPDPATLLVGAPRASHGAGKVYRCTDIGSRNGSKSSCVALKIDPSFSPAAVPIPDRIYSTERLHVLTRKSGGLGISMATGDYSNFMVCAPHSLVTTRIVTKPEQFFLDDMRGYCYNFNLGNFLRRDDDILRAKDRYPITKDINSLYGFSVNYAVDKNMKPVGRIIGQPRLNRVEIRHESRKIEKSLVIDDLANLGYAVCSGYFFDKKQPRYVAGAPGWKSKGKVMIYDPNSFIALSIEGSVLGEYFGASLAAGDFDGDGLDDLAVGAPHWGEVDFGRVRTFYTNRDAIQQNFRAGITLQGTVANAQFGYTLATADLDRDNFSDLVVSAPWEESGVVYIFYGHRDFRKVGASPQIIQRVEPSQFMRLKGPVQRFGFSFSKSIDIDGNGYPDLAIGAHKSGHAIILRSRPVVEAMVKLDSNPKVLAQSTTGFNLSVCADYHGVRAPRTLELEFKMTVDANHKRVKNDGWEHFARQFTLGRSGCAEPILLSLKAETLNFVDPILINVKYGIKEKGGDAFCSDCPVLSRKSVQDSISLTMPFNTGCREGVICNANLSMTASLVGTRQNNEWIVGSGDISLNLIMRNDGEPAYQTEVIVDMPPHIRLRNAIPSCKEDLDNNAVSLVCDFGNPLKLGEQKRLNIALNMENVVELPESTMLTFNITKRTRSVDHGNNTETILGLTVRNMVHLTLSGVTDKATHDYARTEDKSKVLIRHTYQVVKTGLTPITTARLTIEVPTSTIGRNGSFLNIDNPMLTDSSGKTYGCLIHDPNIARQQMNGFQESADIDRRLQRRRREISGDSQETQVTIDPIETEEDTEVYDDELEMEIYGTNTSEVTTEKVQTTDRTIYLNCSSDGISCAQIICHFGLLKTSSDVGSVVLNMVFDADAFYNSNEDSLAVKFNTNASVEILVPYIPDQPVTRNTSAGVSTMLFNIPEPQKLAGWIIPSSVVLGILIFCILAIILFKVGFFNRSKKLENAKAKETEMILNANEHEDERYG